MDGRGDGSHPQPRMRDPRRECPGGHVPIVHYGEDVDLTYCDVCGQEERLPHPRREGVRKTELSVRDRGTGGKPQGKRRTR